MKTLCLSFLFLSLCSVAHADITTGLVGWWRLNEGSGSTAFDSSGKGNGGTETASPSYVTGKIGSYALSFNGSSQYVSVPDNSSLDGTAGTWSLWVKETAVAAGNGYSVLSKEDPTSSFNGISIYEISGTYGVQIKKSDATGALNLIFGNVSDLGWHLITLTFNSGGATTTYFDGVQVSSGTAPAFTFSSQPLRIAHSVDAFWQYYFGSIDDVRIYNRVLSAADVVQLYDSTGPDYTTGLGLWYKFDEGSGTTAADASGNGNSGTLTGGASYAAGQVGTYTLSLSGSSQYVVDANNSGISNSTTPVSVAFWIYPTTSPTAEVIASTAIDTSPFDGVWVQLGDECAGNPTGGDDICWGMSTTTLDQQFVYYNSSIPQNTWTHIVLTYNGTCGAGNLAIYINGAAVTATTTKDAGCSSITNRPWYVGTDATLDDFVTGKIDDFRVYNRALSPGDIAALYEYTGNAGHYFQLNSK